ncbi:hypothetical protein CYMTET_34845 [Cymbomonas tetramitiformis]|uniref:Uncharacterized protein n=1 Tax=Cymbomonas tetramitiformis TaxID=36881 RepID=A0AAE0FAF1_9CHLO|nr:hypothetical protein CYMTET_34845 [Cymbomonas tetramitiformis]
MPVSPEPLMSTSIQMMLMMLMMLANHRRRHHQQQQQEEEEESSYTGARGGKRAGGRAGEASRQAVEHHHLLIVSMSKQIEKLGRRSATLGGAIERFRANSKTMAGCVSPPDEGLLKGRSLGATGGQKRPSRHHPCGTCTRPCSTNVLATSPWKERSAWSTSESREVVILVDHAGLAKHVTNTWELWSTLALEGLEECSRAMKGSQRSELARVSCGTDVSRAPGGGRLVGGMRPARGVRADDAAPPPHITQCELKAVK